MSTAVKTVDLADCFVIEKKKDKAVITGVRPPFLAQYIRENEDFFFLDTGGEHPPCYWYFKQRGVYVKLEKNRVMGLIRDYIEVSARNIVKMRDVEEVYRLLLIDMKRVSINVLNANEKIINFQNGILNLETNELMPHSPQYISTVQIPCNYTPNAGNCPVFRSYLQTLTGGDIEVGRLLWEYLGLVISNIAGHTTKQALLLVGAGDTGKSRYMELLSRLVGDENAVAIDLRGLENRFGTNEMLGKRLAGCADMSFMKVDELKTFKKLTGGDRIIFEAKGKDAISATYRGCLLFCSNAKPSFGGDKGDHVYSRFLGVPCTNVIPPEQRDPAIVDKMYAEREAIVSHAIEALKCFIKRGCKFAEPQVCKAFRAEFKLENDNVLMFLDECTTPIDETAGHDLITTRADFFKAYQKWAKENGYQPLNKNSFQQRLKTANVQEVRRGHMSLRCYDRELTAEAIERYTDATR